MARTPDLADRGVPDSRGPVRFLWWLVTRQRGRILLGSLIGSLWMVSLMLTPYLVQRAIDDGLARADSDALLAWVLVLMAVGVLQAAVGTFRHRVMTRIRNDAGLRTVWLVVRHAVRLGAALPRSVSAGEAVNIGSTDVWRIARAFTIAGPGVGAVIAYIVVAVLLVAISPLLALVVVLGVPLLALCIGPLLGRLQKVEMEYRERQGALTARAGDIVSGLRVLAGIGGKDLFARRYRERSARLREEGYRVGAVTSWIEALTIGMPGILVAVVVWLAARMAAAGEISTGQLVAVYGYVAVLIVPVYFLIQGADDVARALVSARRVIRVLALPPATDTGPHAGAPSGQADLHDPASGLTVPAGRMLAVVTAKPADAHGLVDRLARYTDSDATWGGVRLADLALDEVRRRILAAGAETYLFAGAMREVLAVRQGTDDAAISAAVRDAVATDVLDALPEGLESRVDGQARNLSGGQRQRIRLARALLADADVLLLTEPTSAVDAHTEAAIADRIRERRAGRSTVVAGTSPLLLARADAVAYLVDGRVTATGTHAELLEREPGYRDLVFRGAEDDDLAEVGR